MFSLNSIFDTWQLENILQLDCLPPNCSEEQMNQLENYGQVAEPTINILTAIIISLLFRSSLKQLVQLSSHQLMEHSLILVWYTVSR